MDNKDFNYNRVKFQGNGDTHAVYLNNGTMRQTNVLDGTVSAVFEFTYIYSADGTPRKIPASQLVSMYYADGTLSSDRIINTGGFNFSIKGLPKTYNNFENYNVMIQDDDGKMSVIDGEKVINNVTVNIEW